MNTSKSGPINKIGRVVIPVEIRRALDIQTGTSIEIFVEKDRILLRKYLARCVLCAQDSTHTFRERPICSNCLDEISRLTKPTKPTAHVTLSQGASAV